MKDNETKYAAYIRETEDVIQSGNEEEAKKRIQKLRQLGVNSDVLIELIEFFNVSDLGVDKLDMNSLLGDASSDQVDAEIAKNDTNELLKSINTALENKEFKDALNMIYQIKDVALRWRIVEIYERKRIESDVTDYLESDVDTAIQGHDYDKARYILKCMFSKQKIDSIKKNEKIQKIKKEEEEYEIGRIREIIYLYNSTPEKKRAQKIVSKLSEDQKKVLVKYLKKNILNSERYVQVNLEILDLLMEGNNNSQISTKLSPEVKANDVTVGRRIGKIFTLINSWPQELGIEISDSGTELEMAKSILGIAEEGEENILTVWKELSSGEKKLLIRLMKKSVTPGKADRSFNRMIGQLPMKDGGGINCFSIGLLYEMKGSTVKRHLTKFFKQALKSLEKTRKGGLT